MPLVREHGSDVTTKAIAEAAGIAEGTIFRVFKDKEELLDAVVERAFDTGRLERQLAAIDPDAAARDPRAHRDPAAPAPARGRLAADGCDADGRPARPATRLARPPARPSRHTRSATSGSCFHLARVFEPDAEHLTCTPEQAARLLRLITFSGSHPLDLARPAPDARRRSSISSCTASGTTSERPREKHHADPAAAHLPAALPATALGRRRAADDPDHRLALPAQPERRHHRQRRRHRATPATSCASAAGCCGHAAADRLLDRARSTSAPRPR